MERTIVGIDVGTTKICTLVGEIGENDSLRVTGVGVVPSRGLRKGVITDVEEAAAAIAESVQKAERVAGHTITRAYVGVGGSHISSQNNRGMVAIGKGDRPVDHDDIDRAMEAALAVPVPHNRRIIHSIAREFVLDGQDGVRNPIGLLGFRLEVEAHIVTGAVTSIQNLVRCVEMSQIEVAALVLQPLASADAVLTDEEKDLGVALVDIGGGTTDLALYSHGSIWETQVYAVGGNHLTNDIAVGLRAPMATAEDIKIRYATALPETVDAREMIEVTTFGDEALSTISRRQLAQIVACRTEEMFELIAKEIQRSGFEGLLPAGVVVTGGTAGLSDLKELAADTLQLPVRVGMPRRLRGLVETISSPAYATSVGLLLWGAREELRQSASPIPGGSRAWYTSLLEWLKVFIPRG
ncbi:MAG: cell division protein FtsA [Chloroflexi bacterium]|nr:cell division protein FtsA [Chloroflexota bacterium]